LSIEDFKMYEEWSAYRETLAAEPVAVKTQPVELAGWGSRFGAYLIDSILLSVPMGIYLWEQILPIMESARAGAAVDPVTGQVDQAAMQGYFSDLMAMNIKLTLVFTALAAVYYVVCHATLSQSLGKMAVGIKLVRTDGGRPSWLDAVKRAVINPAVQVIPLAGGLLFLLNGLWPLWDDKNQSLADKVAKTLVVRDS
jgi:uncharacterized RDD family membrane protein YckC